MTPIKARSRRPIRRAGGVVLLRSAPVDLERDAVEQLAGLVGGQDRRLAAFDDVLGAANRRGRVEVR